MRTPYFWLLAALAACSNGASKDVATSDTPMVDGDADTDTDADSDTDSDADTDTDADSDADTDTTPGTGDTGAYCANPVLAQFPADGEVDVYVGTSVFFTLTTADPTATITVADSTGAVVTGATTVTGTLVEWTGGPLLPSTSYDATLTHACGTETAHFTTSDVGEDPLTVDPTGYVYAIDLGTGVWAEPVGLGTVLAALLAGQQLMLSPTGISGGTIDFLGGIGVNDVQDTCIATVDLPAAGWVDPTFSLVAPLLTLDFAGDPVDVSDADVEGAFASDASRIQFGVLHANIDTRNMGPSLGLSSAYDEVCNLVYPLGIACTPCADGQPYCLELTVYDLEAPSVGGTLVPRTVADILADPTCP